MTAVSTPCHRWLCKCACLHQAVIPMFHWICTRHAASSSVISFPSADLPLSDFHLIIHNCLFSPPYLVFSFLSADDNLFGFLCLNLISFSRFLTVCSQTFTRVSGHLLFIWFLFFLHLLFSRHSSLTFLSWCSDIFLGLIVRFPSTTSLFCLHSLQTFETADGDQPAS